MWVPKQKYVLYGPSTLVRANFGSAHIGAGHVPDTGGQNSENENKVISFSRIREKLKNGGHVHDFFGHLLFRNSGRFFVNFCPNPKIFYHP